MDGIIVFCAKYLIVLVVGLVAWAWLQQNIQVKKQMALAGIAALITGYILAKIGDKLFYDPRPFTHGVKALFSHPADNGFPSDHAWLTMLATGLLFFYRRQLAYVSLALAIIIGVARVAAHVHSPIDIIGGFAIGIVASWIGFWAARQMLPHKTTKQN